MEMNDTQRQDVEPVTSSDINSLGSFVFGVYSIVESGGNFHDLQCYLDSAAVKQSAANAVNHRDSGED